MKQIYKTVLSIFLILAVVTTVAIGSKEYINKLTTKDLKKETPPTEKIPIGADQPTAIEQGTYTDIWTKSSTIPAETISADWADIPGMTQTIYLKYPSEITVQYTGESKIEYTDSTDWAYSIQGDVIARIDSQYMNPGTVFMTSNYDWESHGMNFVKSYVPAGWHTIKIQYAVTNGKLDTWYKSMTIIANGYGH